MTVTTEATRSLTTGRALVQDFLTGRVDAEALPEPQWGPIGKQVYERTYARDLYVRDPETGEHERDTLGRRIPQPWMNDLGLPLPANGRTRELWPDTVRRVVLGNLSFVDETHYQADEAAELFELIHSGGALPAGRHLWVVGTSSPWSRNCWSSGHSALTSAHTAFLASRLFEGGGVGANYSNDLLEVTSPIKRRVSVDVTCRATHPDFEAVSAAAGDSLLAEGDAASKVTDEGALLIDVEDSREGWVASWCRIIDEATVAGDDPLSVVIDVSAIRPFGAPLRTFGGTASGPAPFVTAAAAIADVLGRAGSQRRRLTSLELMEIDHQCAAGIVAGGARRSARMSIKHWADWDVLDFIACKATGEHWTTNISVEIDDEFTQSLDDSEHDRHQHAQSVLDAVTEGMAHNGEPGFVNTSEHSRHEPSPIRATNPCGEVGLEADYSSGGLAGGEACNIGSVNLEHFGTDMAGARRAYELMSRFLYRATHKPYPDDLANRIEQDNRRIGAGLMGLQGWCLAHGIRLSDLPDSPTLLRELDSFREVVREAADDLADALATPRPVKVTAVAPTGSISQMFGTQAGGHPVTAARYVRNVRYSTADAAVARLERDGYSVEPDQRAANTVVVSFPTEDVILSRGYDEELIESAADISLESFARLTLAIQDHFCAGGDGLAVSATGQLAPGQTAGDVKAMVRPYLRLKGLTAFPTFSMPQMPIEAIDKERYLELVAQVSANAAFYEKAYGDSNDGACATGACPVK